MKTTLLLLAVMLCATDAVAQTAAPSTHSASSPAPQSTPISASAAAHGEIYPLPHAMRIVLAGDSTVNHTTGWGTAFCERQTTDTECFNSSRNGRSAKSYREQGLWDRALAVHPDYILIQFGANDGPGKGPLLEDIPATTFSEYMRDDIRDARAAGAVPVLAPGTLLQVLTRTLLPEGVIIIEYHGAGLPDLAGRPGLQQPDVQPSAAVHKEAALRGIW